MSKSENRYRRNSKGEWEDRFAPKESGRGNGRGNGGRDGGRRNDSVRSGRGGRDGGRNGRDFGGKGGRDGGYSRREEFARNEARGFEHTRPQFNDFENEQPSSNLIIGRNPVMEALKAGREIDKLVVANGAEGSIIKIVGMAKDKGIPIMYSERVGLDRISGGRAHQGVAAYVSSYGYVEVEDILKVAEERGEDPFIVILDNLEDPHNLGAIMRTCETAGAHGIIIPKRRAVGITDVVVKASAGAVEYMPVAKVVNIAQTIESLKEKGIWVAACDMGEHMYYEQNLTGPMALVVGAEGEGISRLVREKCDYVVSIPMKGHITSLNASNAAAILIYEICRQRIQSEGK